MLSGRYVDGLVVTMRNTDMMDEYLGASGAGAPDSDGLSLLQQYHERHSVTQCRYGCSECVDVCPSQVPISDVLRSRMYAVDYRDRGQAQGAYERLEQNASACMSCSGDPCASACPNGISISRFTRETHDLLGRS